MTRPQIIRADTIDLQSHDAPSAKDHTRQPAHPGPLGDGPPAPHQAIALRHAEQDVEFHPRSPRHSQDLSNKELQLLHEDTDSFDSTNASDQDPHHLQRHGGHGEEMDGGDGDGDDGLDDDMMDKMSSSPSIEDGGYHLPLPWPSRGDSLNFFTTSMEDAALPPPSHEFLSSSPFLSPPVHFPFFCPQKKPDLDPPKDNHHQGGYTTADVSSLNDDYENESGNRSSSTRTDQHVSNFYEEFDDTQDSYDADLDSANLHHLLLPPDDPILDNSFDDAPLSSPPASPSPSSTSSASSWEGRSPSRDDDYEDISFIDDSRFIDSGWGGECLRDTEDIDFDFVYALHTFVATVEGQANATKGDTMVLLDDTNSYWWLVRVVKDGSIGYLPAEHIETPTERLARLNKHRNIDLSQTMLGDNSDKPKNPLKQAIRRRNAKSVHFAAPTYYEASEVDYSTEEEDGEESAQGSHEHQSEEQDKNGNEIIAMNSSHDKLNDEVTTVNESQALVEVRDSEADQITQPNSDRIGDETSERSDEGSNSKSKKGTVRNTDSFFKDDSVETRKINLTPSLLRDDSSGSTVKSVDTKDLKTRGSLDSLEKAQSQPEKSKEDKKRKEKKGMLSGLFKRREKKNKGLEEEVEDNEKVSEELLRDSQPKESMESLHQDTQASKGTAQPQRQISKLQKAPPAKIPSPQKGHTREPISQVLTPADQRVATPQQDVTASMVGNARSTHVVQHVATQLDKDVTPSRRGDTPELLQDQNVQAEQKATQQGSIDQISQLTPEKQKIPKKRMPLDENDSSTDIEETSAPLMQRNDGLSAHTTESKERLSESPVQVDIPDQLRTQPPPLMVDTSSQEDPSGSPVSPASSPELVEAPREGNNSQATPASTTQSPSNTPTWSDASLRAYLEDDSDVRDLLLVVHDKSDVKPADLNHPLVRNLFKEENRKLGELSNQLDGLLGDWLARKSKTSSR